MGKVAHVSRTQRINAGDVNLGSMWLEHIQWAGKQAKSVYVPDIAELKTRCVVKFDATVSATHVMQWSSDTVPVQMPRLSADFAARDTLEILDTLLNKEKDARAFVKGEIVNIPRMGADGVVVNVHYASFTVAETAELQVHTLCALLAGLNEALPAGKRFGSLSLSMRVVEVGLV